MPSVAAGSTLPSPVRRPGSTLLRYPDRAGGVPCRVLRRHILLFPLLVLGTTAAPVAARQLKLPGKLREVAKPADGNVAAYRVCLVCDARNYTHPPSGRVDEAGRELAWCDTCQRDTAQEFPGAADAAPGLSAAPRQGGDLKLPRPKPVAPAPAPVPAPVVAPAPVAPAPTPDALRGLSPAAIFILTEVGKLPNADESLAQRAVESLLALREDGLAAARVALFDEKPVATTVAARVLLRGGVAADADLVVRRLRAKLPTGAGSPLLRTLVENDPVRATPELFAELLDHPQAQLRNAAARELEKRLVPESLALLEPVLASSRADTRMLALQLVARLEGPKATAAILRVLDDPTARVASAAVQALGTRDEAGLDEELLRTAFRQRWILRPGAYALLAVMEREDALLRPILRDEHVDPLLEAMSSSDPFLSGTCAAALAGLGFRSGRADVAAWLDGPVVDRLVFCVSGKVFHTDYSALSGPAVRRLRLATGQPFGPDGPAWVDWWVKARTGFQAKRAALAIQPGEEGALALRAIAPDSGLDLQLEGPDFAAPEAIGPSAVAAAPSAVERIHLTAAQSSELAAALAREGVLAAERLPGAYASEGRGDRTLEIAVRGRSKSFTVGPRAKEPWFERLLSLAEALRDANRWQLFLVEPVARGDRTAWDAEAAWWAAARTDTERADRLAHLALASLVGGTPARRERALTELERAGTRGPLPEESFATILAALRRETNLGARARRLTLLAIATGRGVEKDLRAAAAQRLADVLLEGFGPAGRELVVETLARSERAFVRRLAADENPLVRRAATEALGRSLAATPGIADEEDVRALLALLSDRDSDVQTAAAEALGAAKVEAARDDLLARARLGQGPVRCAALRAAGALGGAHVLDALVLGVGDPNAEVQRAAVDGLGRLRDPAATQVLVTLLAEQSDAPLRDAARAALVRVGEAAIPALRRAAELPGSKSRREAALVLAGLLSHDAVPPLLAIVSQDRQDTRAADELAILSCVDPRGSVPDPSTAWWNWWEGVRHDDALVWFRAAIERLEIPQPPLGALEGGGTIEGQVFLLSLLEREEKWLVERARRELGRLLQEDVGELPPRGPARIAWVRERRAELQGLPESATRGPERR